MGAVALNQLLVSAQMPRLHAAVTAFMVLVATFYPLGPPSLGAEVTWLLTRYPRRVDWNEMKRNARVIRDSGLEDRLTNGLAATAMAVWTPLRIEGGPWKRVRPPSDGAERISVGDRNYILSIAPNDPVWCAWMRKVGFASTAADTHGRS